MKIGTVSTEQCLQRVLGDDEGSTVVVTVGVMSMGCAEDTLLHSFGRPKLVLVFLCWWPTPKCQRSRTGHPPSPLLVPSPTTVLYVSCNCRACCSSGHSRRGQGKRAKRRMGARAASCRWACALFQPASALADSFGFFWEHCASAKAESLAEKGKKGKTFFKRQPQACKQWGWHPERIPKPGSKKESIRRQTEAWRVLRCLGLAFFLRAL